MTLNSILIYEKDLIHSNSLLLKVGLALLIALLAIAMFLILRKKRVNATISIGCIIIAIISLVTFSHNYTEDAQKVDRRAASLTEISEFIDVEDNTITIKSLNSSDRYKYSDTKTNKDRTFKLGKDEKFKTYHLTDQSGRKFLIDNEEYEMLNTKRHS